MRKLNKKRQLFRCYGANRDFGCSAFSFLFYPWTFLASFFLGTEHEGESPIVLRFFSIGFLSRRTRLFRSFCPRQFCDTSSCREPNETSTFRLDRGKKKKRKKGERDQSFTKDQRLPFPGAFRFAETRRTPSFLFFLAESRGWLVQRIDTIPV